MTLPDQRTRAVIYAAQFLTRLASPYAKDGIKRVPAAVRAEARRILRHFPLPFDLHAAAVTAPDVFDAQAVLRYDEEQRQIEQMLDAVRTFQPGDPSFVVDFSRAFENGAQKSTDDTATNFAATTRHAMTRLTNKALKKFAEEAFNAKFPPIPNSRYRRAFCCRCRDAVRVPEDMARLAYNTDPRVIVCDDCARGGEIDYEKACANAAALTPRQREKKI